jgi:diguanylate cyclase (GGDEF)-like protein
MDQLSELPGPAEFQALVLREEMRRSRTGESIAVAVLDVDGLGEIGKIHGRRVAAELLGICVDSLRSTLRAADQLARTGLDEFSVLLHATDSKRANHWAVRFDKAFEKAVTAHQIGEATCAIGIADSEESSTLVEAAARARRRMEVVQTVRRLRRRREAS